MTNSNNQESSETSSARTQALQAQKIDASRNKKNKGYLRETAEVLILAVAIAAGIRTFVAESRFIPTGSMIPTLKIDDRLMVEKITYLFHSPERQDIVVFRPTDRLVAQGSRQDLIKRIIGVPGDKVEIKAGKVLVNDQPLAEGYIMEPINRDFSAIVVPPNQYFMMGDNRNNSYDSRFWGFVPRDHIIGKAAFRTFPFNCLGDIKDCSAH
jgi:signal peptidase I